MSLLTIITTAAGELGLPNAAQATSVIGNTDTTISQLLALANREGKEFAAIGGQWSGWPELRKQYTFTMVTAGTFNGITTVEGSNQLRGFSTVSGIGLNYGVSGGSILTGAQVMAVDPIGLTVTLDTPAQSSVSGQSFTFGQIAYALPSDLAFFIPQTEWDRNFRWQMLGPISPQEWQTIVSGISPVGPRIRFRVMGNQFYINPPPGATQTDLLAFEYITNCWCSPNPGAYPPTQTVWTTDTDIYAWPEDTMILGIKWRFKAAKGLDYSEEKDTWQNAVDRQIARSGTVRTLPLNACGSDSIHLLGAANIPDTGFGA